MYQPVIKRIEVYQTGIKLESGRFLDNIFVRVAARAGGELLEGWGEGAAGDPAFTGQSREIAADDIIRRIGPFLLGKSFGDVSSLENLLEDASALRPGARLALSACDGALFSILSRFQRTPPYQLMREYLWLPPLQADFPLNFYPSNPFRPALEIIENRMAPGPYVAGGEAFTSAEQLMHLMRESLGPAEIITQPFHRDSPRLSGELRKMIKKSGFDTKVFADSLPLTKETAEEMAKSGTFDGAVYRMGRDGGLCNLLSVCGRLKNYPSFSLITAGGDSTSLGFMAGLQGYLGTESFHCGGLGPVLERTIPMPPEPGLNDSIKETLPELRQGLSISGFPLSGVRFDADFLEHFALFGSVVSKDDDGAIRVQTFPYANRKPDFRRVVRFELNCTASGKE